MLGRGCTVTKSGARTGRTTFLALRPSFRFLVREYTSLSIYMLVLTRHSFSRWVTSVGGTKIPQDGTVFENEHAWRWSGGGFGLDFDRPRYQDAAIEHYFRTSNITLPYFFNGDYSNGGEYNRNGRGIPDISASKSL